jgi:hypothetical protein
MPAPPSRQPFLSLPTALVAERSLRDGREAKGPNAPLRLGLDPFESLARPIEQGRLDPQGARLAIPVRPVEAERLLTTSAPVLAPGDVSDLAGRLATTLRGHRA